jgi:hypothetical protein
LFALACQFVFTFGHVHLTGIVADAAAISAGGQPGVAAAKGAVRPHPGFLRTLQ